MTFVKYGRTQRLGGAFQQRRSLEDYDARDTASSFVKDAPLLKTTWLDTPLGPMIAVADEAKLYLLEFAETRGLEREMEILRHLATLEPGITAPLTLIEKELTAYFKGTLTTFQTPFVLRGSPFQQQVWEELLRIPYGQTRSYGDQAKAIGKETATRAVANANGANPLAILVPCHRIINTNGKLGGYGGGLVRKQWLLAHEKRYSGPID